MNLQLFGATDLGQVRKNNEDNFWIDQDLGLMVVADGMGGHAAGEVASQMAVDVIREQVGQCLKTGHIPSLGSVPPHLSDRAHLLVSVIRMANEVIYAASQEGKGREGMGTTIVLALIGKKKFTVAHVGDSRMYLYRQGTLRRVTNDHSLVVEQVARGLLTQEQAEKSNIKNILTRALGIGSEVEVDVDEQPISSGDTFLLCTDGLSQMVEDRVIQQKLGHVGDPAQACQELIRQANENSGKDNVTVVIGMLESSSWLKRVRTLLKNNSKGAK